MMPELLEAVLKLLPPADSVRLAHAVFVTLEEAPELAPEGAAPVSDAASRPTIRISPPE